MALFDFDAHASAGELGRTSRVDVSWTFTDTSILLQSNGIPFHSYGNPLGERTANAQNYEVQIIYRGGTNEAGSRTDAVGQGPIGWCLNGVAIFAPGAGTRTPTGYTAVKGYQYNVGYRAELSLGYNWNKDLAGAYSAPGAPDINGNPTGVYHYTEFSFANAWTTGEGATDGSRGLPEASVITYLGSSLTHANGHSKIIGWALDGFPIYGPYGYTNPLDSNTAVKRMNTGYILKDSSTRSGTVNNLNTYPMGMFVEDYQWSSNGDLDRHNGRYCVTPDYPQGTYAYFVTIDNNGTPAFPYVIGPTYYGTPTAQTAGPGQTINLAALPQGAPVSEKANSVAVAATFVTNRTNQVPDIITWVTPRGSLGTFKESAELSISLLARSPVVDNIPAAGFDPRLSIVSNGNGDFEAIMPSTKHKIAFKYTPGKVANQEFPDPLGEVAHGSYPNALVPVEIRATPYEFIIPYRGGRNEGARVPYSALNDQIGVSAVGIPFYGFGGRFVRGEDNAVFQVNDVEANGNGKDLYGGWPDRFGTYRYQDSRFINANAWARIPKFSAGYRWQDGHSMIIGWALDGYPIYGPYGYVNSRDVGAVQLMVSGYRLKRRPDLNRPIPITAVVTRGTKRTLDVTLNINTGIYPGMILEGGSWDIGTVWVENVNNYVVTLNRAVTLEANTFLRASWKFGALVQDYEYASTPGSTLDRFNGRFCVTPEFPGGTYAYFATQDADGQPVFPYMVGPQFKGDLEIQEDPPIPGVADLSGTKTVSGLTYTVISGEIPPGTQLYRTTGLIYGNPVVVDAKSTVARRYDFTVRAENTRGKIADRAFTIFINNISPPTLNDATDPVTNTVDLGTFFDSEKIAVQLAYTEANPGANLNWSISRGSFPAGLTLTQAGLITGFALAPRAAGAAGTGQFDKGVFDQYVYDFEGATLTKTYKFTVRLYDGVQFAERKYQMTILAKSFFRADNSLLKADADDIRDDQNLITERTIFRADKDGFVYPTIVTDPATIPVIRQDRAFAFKFDAYFPNPNYKIRYEITNSPADEFGDGFDAVGFDSSTLALPDGLSLDPETGWITGTIGIIPGFKNSFDFQIRASVDVPVSRFETETRYSNAVQFRLQILSAAANQILFDTPADLGTIDNGRISTLQIAATSEDGQELIYSLKSTMRELIGADAADQRIVSNVPSRMPQGLKLLPSGRISGRTTFDYFSMDRNQQAEILLDRNSTTVDAIYTFVVEARTLDNTSFQDQTFTLRVRNINKRPFENLYMRSLNSPDLRKLFRSILEDTNLDGIIYRPDDPWFGIPKTLSFLAVPGLKADTPANYVQAMANFHYNKTVNFGELKTAVAVDDNLNPIYEVLYVEVKEPGNAAQRSSSILRQYTDIADVSRVLTIESNTFENMRGALVDDIGYEYQGALPRWMVNVQPDTKRPIGFVRAVVLAYANPGQVRRLRVAFLRSLLRGTFGFNSTFNQFSFVADRYEWDRTLSVNYNANTRRFNPSRETTFDISAPIDVIDKGPWLSKVTGVSADLNSIGYNSESFIAVGKNNTFITSRKGDRWDPIESSVDFTYRSSLRADVPVGSNVLYLLGGVDYRVGDEVLQQGTFASQGKSYITEISYAAVVNATPSVIVQASNASTITSGVSNTIPAGTTIELEDENGDIIDVSLLETAYAGNIYLKLEGVTSFNNGLFVSIKGLDNVNPTNLTAISPAIPTHNIVNVTGGNLIIDSEVDYPVASGANIEVYETFVSSIVGTNQGNLSVILESPTTFVIPNQSVLALTENFVANITSANISNINSNISIVLSTPTTFALASNANIRVTETANVANVHYMITANAVPVNSNVIYLATLPLVRWANAAANITVSNVTTVTVTAAVDTGANVIPVDAIKSFWGSNSSITTANVTTVTATANITSGNSIPVSGSRASMIGAYLVNDNPWSNELALTLGSTTTNVINAGTTILLNDGVGNVFALTTANITAADSDTIYTTANIFNPTLANLVNGASAFIPTIGGLTGKLQGVEIDVRVSSPVISSLQRDAELTLAMRINAPSAAGNTRIYMSNTDRIAVRSDVRSQPFVATTFAAGGYNSNAAASTDSVQVVIPAAAVQGVVVQNMTVLGPSIPQGSTVSSVITRGSLTYIDLDFPAGVTGINSIGSVVLENTAYSIRLNANLTYPLEVGTELIFDDFTGDPQTVTLDTSVPAGGNVIDFVNPVGRTVIGSNFRQKGFKNSYASVANVATLGNNSLYLNNVSGNTVEFTIPFGTTLNFEDSEGNVQYVTSQNIPANTGFVEFESNVFSTLVGTDVQLLGFPVVNRAAGIYANITAVNQLAFTFTLDRPITHEIPAGSNVVVYSVNTGVTYLTNTSLIEVGQLTIPFTTSPDPDWVGVGNANVTLAGIQYNTVIANTQASNVFLSVESNSTILANTSIRLTDGSASVSYVIVSNVSVGETQIPIDGKPAKSLYGSNVTIVGLPAGYTVTSRAANTVVINGTAVATIPQFTTFEFDDGNGHTANLTLASEASTGDDSFTFTTPPLTPLDGSRTGLNGTGIFSFTSQGLVVDGTTVIDKTSEYIVLSQPLLANIGVGFDESFSYGLSSADYNQVRWLNERWVIVGNKALVLSQDTNGNWQQKFAYPYGDLISVAYGGGLYVAVGTAGLILTSEDLESWDLQASSTTATHRSIAHNNGIWYIVSDEGFVQTSSDGVVWTDITEDVWATNIKKSLTTVKYLGGNWYILGDSGTVILSADSGATWTVYNAGTTSKLNDIFLTAGILIAVGNNGFISESRNGTTWSPTESGINLNLSSITSDGAVALTTGVNGLILGSSGFFVVDFAVRNISFEMFNNNSVDVLATKGYRVEDGQTCIWAQQEKFPAGEFRGPRFENDGWNNYANTFDMNYDSVAFDTKAITTVLVTNPIPGSSTINITSTQGISVGDYVTVGSYKLASDVRVTDVFPLENKIVVNKLVIAVQGEVISFYNPVGYDTKSYVYGYEEHARDPNIINQRAGIWRCNVSANNIVTMGFVRQIEIGQIVLVKRENTKLFYDPDIKNNQTVPGFSLVEQELQTISRTTFDGSGTRFSNNRDQYQEPGALTKYIKFPRIGVFE